MKRTVIADHEFRMQVEISSGMICCKALPHFLLEGSTKSFDNACLGLVMCRKEIEPLRTLSRIADVLVKTFRLRIDL